MMITGPSLCGIETCKHAKCITAGHCTGEEFRVNHAQKYIADSVQALVDEMKHWGVDVQIEVKSIDGLAAPQAAPLTAEYEQRFIQFHKARGVPMEIIERNLAIARADRERPPAVSPDAAERDAARYRCIRMLAVKGDDDAFDRIFDMLLEDHPDPATEQEFDAAIDAAMKELK